MIFLIIAILAFPYVWLVKNAQMRLVAAYFIFLTGFALSAWVTFMGLLTAFAVLTDITGDAAAGWPAAVIFAIAVLSGIFLGTWLIRMPPSPSRRPR